MAAGLLAFGAVLAVGGALGAATDEGPAVATGPLVTAADVAAAAVVAAATVGVPELVEAAAGFEEPLQAVSASEQDTSMITAAGNLPEVSMAIPFVGRPVRLR